MAATRIQCGFTGCEYVSECESEQVALIQFQSHMAAHQQTPQARVATTKQKLPPIERPKLKQDIIQEEWDSFNQDGSVSGAALIFPLARRPINSLTAVKEV